MNKRLFCVVVSAMSFLNSCDGSMAIGTKDGSRPTEFGRVAIDVDLDPVAVLGRSMEMSPRRLVLLFSSGGVVQVRDTIEMLRATDLSRSFELAAPRSWQLNSLVFDQRDSLLYQGSSTFRIIPESTTSVSMRLQPKFSSARARFPVQGYLTRFEMSIDGRVVGDSTVERWSRNGDTIEMNVDYLQPQSFHSYSIRVYGKPWESEILLYALDTILQENVAVAVPLMAKWVGPSTPPPGAANLSIGFDPINTIVFQVGYEQSAGVDFGIPWSPFVSYDSFVDDRDGRRYRTVQIGTRTWMAEDLKYRGDDGSIGVWPDGNIDSGMKYGAWYTWSEAMGGSADRDHSCFFGVHEEWVWKMGWDGEPVRVAEYSCLYGPAVWKGVCPAGWHLPSGDWYVLVGDVGGTIAGMANVGDVLRAVGGWSSGQSVGTDPVGFRALPNWWSDYPGTDPGHNYASWWTAQEYSWEWRWPDSGWNHAAGIVGIGGDWMELYEGGKSSRRAVRCVRD